MCIVGMTRVGGGVGGGREAKTLTTGVIWLVGASSPLLGFSGPSPRLPLLLSGS